jgi:pimeloyl-ACP methyl ester carboxylesterase
VAGGGLRSDAGGGGLSDAGGGARIVRLRAPDGPVQARVWPASGTGETPTLLAMHGWTDSAEVFGPLVSALGGSCAVVAIDAPAHGGTPLRQGPYVIADHQTSALTVLNALPRLVGAGRRSVVAYGHSMGALTAARLGAARPGLVRGLVLEEPARTTLRRTQSSARMRTWMHMLRSGSHADRVAWARANHPDWPQAEYEPWARAKESVDLQHLDRPVDWGEPLPALLSEVPAPVLIIRGEPALGGIVSRTGGRRCAAACPGEGRVLALAAGHSPRREAPSEFRAALEEVLRNW